jgi:hypothetical protein
MRKKGTLDCGRVEDFTGGPAAVATWPWRTASSSLESLSALEASGPVKYILQVPILLPLPRWSEYL